MTIMNSNATPNLTKFYYYNWLRFDASNKSANVFELPISTTANLPFSV